MINTGENMDDIVSLVARALPPDFDFALLKAFGKPEWWEIRPQLACAYALRKCQTLDWTAYFRHNSDVKAQGMDPVLHFLRYGVHEGRKLYLKPGLGSSYKAIPDISVIVTGYPDAPDHLLDSLLDQTYANIEIILAPEAGRKTAWTDVCLPGDPRIRIIQAQDNSGRHSARARAVEVAAGRFILFLDITDRLLLDACARMLAADCLPNGFICFNAQILFGRNFMTMEREALEKAWNAGSEGKYMPHEFMPAICKGEFSQTLRNKLYGTVLCKIAFAIMESDISNECADYYEALVLATMAQAAEKSNACLMVCLYYEQHGFYHAMPLNAANNSDGHCSVFVAYKNVCKKIRHTNYLSKIQDSCLAQSISKWLTLSSESNQSEYFDSMASRYGIIELLGGFINQPNLCLEEAALRFRNYKPGQLSVKKTSIGIFYHRNANGGAEKVYLALAPILLKLGYKVTIFFEESHPNDENMPESLKIVYLAAYGEDGMRIKSSLQALDQALKRNPVDIMMCHSCYEPYLFWQIMLLKYRGIEVQLFLHNSFFNKLMQPQTNFPIQQYAAVVACGDKVAVLSRYEHLYYRQLGVNAFFLPNPVRQPDSGWKMPRSFNERKNRIIAIGRLSEGIKNVGDCLRILALVRRVLPNLEMTFIGSFAGKSAELEFYSLAENLGVSGHIRVTGWLREIDELIDEGVLMLSTALHESFGLAICECQGRGLPIVMYDLPIEPAIDNPAIIRICPGDIKSAAREILSLLQNEPLWQQLSIIGRQQMRRYSMQEYEKMVKNFLSESAQAEIGHSPEDYLTVMDALAWYGMHHSGMPGFRV